jgi:hypothetical protein
MKTIVSKHIIQQSTSARTLPTSWDDCSDSYFQTRSFLAYNEAYNPCQQRYYWLQEAQNLAAAAVVYTLPIDLFTFSNIPSPVRMQVIGIPTSISAPGLFGRPEAVSILLKHLLEAERGLILGLNLPPELDTRPGIQMDMLPTVELHHQFEQWQDYAPQLRAAYRRRVQQITRHWQDTQAIRTACSQFTYRHYQLYLDILRKSDSKLETLSYPFFKHLPERFYLTSYYHHRQLLSWHVNCEDRKHGRLYFFFGGHDYKLNSDYRAYFNNLIGVLKEGIEDRFFTIDFGQTAEIPKMRLGGKLSAKRMFLYHANPLIRWALKKSKRLIEIAIFMFFMIRWRL